MVTEPPPLVLHVVYRFDTGGLENGVVNLINHMPAGAYRHAVLALTEVTSFSQRINRSDVECIALHKPPGHTFWRYPRLYRLLRRLQPQIVHTRNLAALEVQAPAWAANVPVRIHGEHGLDLSERGGDNTTYQRIRRLYRPLVHHYTPLSQDLQRYLVDKVQVPMHRITRVGNGVDTLRFYPAARGPQAIAGCPFDPQRHFLLGTVGRMQTIKDPALLVQAFIHAIELAPSLRQRLRLVMVGEGPLRAQLQTMLCEAGLAQLAWLPGARSDVPEILRGLHAFALPSRSEGISNAILEAMASGLPVLATAVGGNSDLVAARQTGQLVASGDRHGMALRLLQWAFDPYQAARMGQAGRARAEACFSLQSMVQAYQAIYDRQLLRVNATRQLALV